MRPTRILVLGASGQLGKRVAARMLAEGHMVFTDKVVATMDSRWVFRGLDRRAPEIVINCVAMTNVDDCEQDFERACMINGIYAEHLAKWCKKNNALLVHISTDMIFGGATDSIPPWAEDALPNPINKYGVSKVLAEGLIAKSSCTALVLRVQHLWSSEKGLISYSVAKAGSGEHPVAVEMLVKPTSARLIAGQIATLINEGWTGTFNLGPVDVMTTQHAIQYAFNLLEVPSIEITSFPFAEFYEGKARRFDGSQLKTDYVLSQCAEIKELKCVDHIADICKEIQEDRYV